MRFYNQEPLESLKFAVVKRTQRPKILFVEISAEEGNVNLEFLYIVVVLLLKESKNYECAC
jgi:hypothetical protein